ncbi:MAG: alpha/beta hydrolase [Candidatus Omnitrophica bacterium]|nr:alpha/beta hydrolase [Candidatus Omnitrophota bacterium]MCB9719315.1 alpha/beta hydrolase [Candidatus Omnitrophota bacterium]
MKQTVFPISVILSTAMLTGCASLNPVANLEYGLIYIPSREMKADPQSAGLAYEDVYLKTADGVRLNGWFLKGRGDTATMLFFHGNAGNISHRMERLALFRDMGLNVFIIDYRGYGRSKGRPTEEGLYLDGFAAYDYLLKRDDVDPDRIIVYGASLGGAVAVEVAAKRPVAGLIVEASFTSIPDVAKLHVPWVPRSWIGTRMDSLTKIRAIEAPKLILHSSDDEVIPYRMAESLFRAAPEPKSFIPLNGNHAYAWQTSGDRFVKGIEAFLIFHRFM